MMTKIAVALACVSLLSDAGCARTQPSAVAKYTCSMNPEVVQDEPGSCPKCGMKLVEKK